jgi:hypothetical protein
VTGTIVHTKNTPGSKVDKILDLIVVKDGGISKIVDAKGYLNDINIKTKIAEI